MSWKERYEIVLKRVCESPMSEANAIVEQGEPSFSGKLIENPNAGVGSIWTTMLDEKTATEDDYREFCRYIYAYIGQDVEDYFPSSIAEKKKRLKELRERNKK